MSDVTVTVNVNGMPRELTVPAQELLLDTLRERLGLTGAKRSCDVQVCGTCTVLVDNEPVSGCTYLTADADGRSVLTIEGFAETDEFAEFERAFADRAALQCGFCTSGIVLTLKALRDAGQLRDREDAIAGLDGNVCRCTGYKSILEAAQALASGPVGTDASSGARAGTDALPGARASTDAPLGARGGTDASSGARGDAPGHTEAMR